MNEETLFHLALEKLPNERAAFLDQACAGDAALRERVEVLLKAHEESGNFLDRPVLEGLAEELKDKAAQDGTQTEPKSDAGAEISLDFLGSAQKPGSLGRLGHYDVLEVVGQGGMGIVLKAFDENLHRVVAIKVMAPQLATNATARRRFTREAQAAAAVRNDHVIDIHAVEETAPYLVMEYIEGQTLQEKLDQTGPLELKEILRIGYQTACGLAAAHKQGLIHRDIKPANIMLENGVERVKITDFGLARAADDASVTQSGVIAGTPMYMAPEQAAGETLDHRADLFSLGTVLYVMCTGRPPFRASGSLAILRRVADDTPRPIREINSEIPQWLCDIIEKLHAKKREERFQSAQEVADVLAKCLADLQLHGGVVLSSGVASAPCGVVGAGKPKPGQRGVSRSKRLLLAGSILLALSALAALAVFLAPHFLSRHDPNLLYPGPEPQSPVQQVIQLKPKTPFYQNSIVRIKFSYQAGRGHAACIMADRTLKLFELPSGNEVGSFIANDHGLAFSADGKVLAFGSYRDESKKEEGLGFVDLNTQPDKSLTFSRANILNVYSMAFDPTSKTLAVASRFASTSVVSLWDVVNKKERTTLPPQEFDIMTVAFSPDSKLLAMGGKPGVILWDLKENRQKEIFTLPYAVVAQFARDGVHLAMAAENTGVNIGNVYVCSVGGKSPQQFLIGHKFDPQCLAFTADEKVLASGDAGGRHESEFPATIRLWEVATGKPLATLVGHDNWVNDLHFSSDGRALYSASRDGTIRVWNVSAWTGAPGPPLNSKDLSSLEKEPPTTKPAEIAPFIIRAKDARAERKFATLAEAVAAAQSGDTIEIRGNGPFALSPIKIEKKALTIRAGPGVWPVLDLAPISKGNPFLIDTDSPLVLEGLDLSADARDFVTMIIRAGRQPVRAANCRFHVRGGPCIANPIDFALQNCQIISENVQGRFRAEAVELIFTGSAKMVMENCLVAGHGIYLNLHKTDPQVTNGSLHLTRNTFLLGPAVSLELREKELLPRDYKGAGPIRLSATGNIFDVDDMMRTESLPDNVPFTNDAEEHFWRLLSVQGGLNAFPSNARYSINCKNSVAGEPGRTYLYKTMEGFHRMAGGWSHITGPMLYQGGDLRAKWANPVQLTPLDFRLVKGSAGYRHGADGKDLGADVDLVGPGPAYERWKQTPAYQEWEKKTAELMKGK